MPGCGASCRKARCLHCSVVGWQLFGVLTWAWDAEALQLATLAAQALYNFSLGWAGAVGRNDGSSLTEVHAEDAHPRFTAEECLEMLPFLDEIAGVAEAKESPKEEEEEEEEAGVGAGAGAEGEKGEGQAGDASLVALAGVCKRLAAVLKAMVRCDVLLAEEGGGEGEPEAAVLHSEEVGSEVKPATHGSDLEELGEEEEQGQ